MHILYRTQKPDRFRSKRRFFAFSGDQELNMPVVQLQNRIDSEAQSFAFPAGAGKKNSDIHVGKPPVIAMIPTGSGLLFEMGVRDSIIDDGDMRFWIIKFCVVLTLN